MAYFLRASGVIDHDAGQDIATRHMSDRLFVLESDFRGLYLTHLRRYISLVLCKEAHSHTD